MINQQLIDYVRAQRTNGLSKEAIVQALAAGGWTTTDVNEAFMAIDGVKVPPPAPPTPTPSMQPQARTILPPPGAAQVMGTATIGNPSSTPGPVPTPAGSFPRPKVAMSEFSTATVAKRRVWPWVLLIVLFIAIIGGGVAAAVFYPSMFGSLLPNISSIINPPQEPAPVDITPREETETPPTTTSTTTATTTTSVTASTTVKTSTSSSSH